MQPLTIFLFPAVMLIKMPFVYSQCIWRHTQPNVDGRGMVIFLDRHHLHCPYDDALGSFHLRRAGSNHIYYRYLCCHVKHGCSRQASSTPFSADGGRKNTTYLSRHQPKCNPQDSYMKEFRLVRNSQGNMIRLKCTYINFQFFNLN